MAQQVKLQADGLRELRRVDERLMSYNVEMTEVTGGTFWKEYTPGQIAGTEGFPPSKGLEDIANAMQVYPPVNLYDEKLRAFWPRSSVPFGCVFPAPGPAKPTTILTV